MTYDVFHFVQWNWLIAADLFLGGVGVGAFVYAVLLRIKCGAKCIRLARVAAVSAPVFVALGLLFLMSEMGQPLRAYKVILRFQVTSMLSWGALMQGLFLAGATLYAGLMLWESDRRAWVGRWCRLIGYLTLPVALFVGVYHGLLLFVVEASAFWNTVPTVLAAVFAFLATGVAVVVLWAALSRSLRQELAQATFTWPLLGAALLGQLVTFGLQWALLSTGAARDATAVAAVNQQFGRLFWIWAVAVGLIVPFAGFLRTWWRVQRSADVGSRPGVADVLVSYVLPVNTSGPGAVGSAELEPALLAGLALLVLVGGAVFRYVWVMGGQLL